MLPHRKIAPTVSLLAVTLALLVASALAWACGPAAPPAQDGAPPASAEAEPTATPTPDATPRLELVAEAVFRLVEQAEQEEKRGPSGASGGPRLPGKVYAHITALTENVDDLKQLLRDNDASDISVINDAVISTVEAQIPPALLLDITRHPAFLEAFTDGIYPNMEQSLNENLTMYAAGLLTAAQASEYIMGEPFMEYPENIVIKVELTSPEVNDRVRDFLTANRAFPHTKKPGEVWFYAGVPVSVVGELSSYPGVSYIDQYPQSWPGIEPAPKDSSAAPASMSSQTQPVSRQGAWVHGALAWHPRNTGQDVRVGIIDSGFKGFVAQMGTELPATVHYRCLNPMTGASNTGTGIPNSRTCEIMSDHGTVVAEAAYDVAPGAILYISNDHIDEATTWMTDNDVEIINHSRNSGWDGPGDGTSKRANSSLKVVADAVSDGALWVNAAGNYAQDSWFKRNLVTNKLPQGNFVQFQGTDDCNNVHLKAGMEYDFQTRWAGTWSGANDDLSVQIWRNEYFPQGRVTKLVLKARSNDVQLRTSGAKTDPYDTLSFKPRVTDPQYCLRVQVPDNVVPGWVQVQNTSGVALMYNGDGQSIGQPGDSREAGMLTVGAAGWNTPSSIRSYSSVGPTRDGRTKPDVVGADGAYASVHGRSANGTSQAAPHIAGLAALAAKWFKRAGVSYTPASLASYIKANAMRPSGQSANSWGSGFVKLPCPSKFVSLSGTAINSSWTSTDCVSARRTTANSSYTNNKVDFYTFTLAKATIVNIDLVSHRNTYLYLINGLNTGGTASRSSDDNGGDGTNSRITGRLPAGTYTVAATTYLSGKIGDYRLRIADTPYRRRASLAPVPSSVAFRANGQWRPFTVSANVPVKVIANPVGSTKRVEITRSATSSNFCPPEWDDGFGRNSGESIYLAGCVAGTGKVQLRDALDERLLLTYTFTIRTVTTSRTSTVAPAVQLRCLPISSIRGSRLSTGTSVYLSWSNPTGGKTVNGRQIDIRKWVLGSNGQGQWNLERYITVGSTATSAYHIGTDRNAYYAYRIRSQCAGSSNSGWSGWQLVAPQSAASRGAGGTSPEPEPTPGASAPPEDDARYDAPEAPVQPTPEAATGPSEPSGLTAAYANGAVILSWTPGSNPNYVKQVVKRRERGVRPAVWTDFELDASDNTYTDATAVSGKTYIYRVKGLRDNGRGGDSNRATVTIP